MEKIVRFSLASSAVKKRGFNRKDAKEAQGAQLRQRAIVIGKNSVILFINI